MKLPHFEIETRFAVVYAIFGGLWIILSDTLLASMGRDAEFITTVSIYKGWVFVVLSAALIYFLLRQERLLRLKTENKFQQCEENYRLLFENNPHPMWVYDLESLAFRSVNEATIAKYGYSRAEFLCMTVADIHRQEDVARLMEEVAKPQDVSQNSDGWRHCLKDGTIIAVEIASRKIDLGARKCVLVVAQDVTERKRAETVRRESEEQYRLFQGIMRSSSDGILAVNRENEVLFANERFVEMWMIPPELMAKKDDTLLLQYVLDQLSDPQSFLQKVQELYNSTEESFDTLVFKDGRVFDRLSRPMLQAMEVSGRVWSFRDVTERKQAEQSLQQAEAKYRILVEQIPAAVYLWELGDGGRCHYISPQIETMLGYPVEEWLAEPDLFFRLVLPDDRACALAAEIHSRETGEPLHSEFRMLTRDGRVIWVRDESVVQSSNPNQPQLNQGVLMDITERKRAEEALQESEARFHSLFDNATIGMYRTTPDGRVLLSNPAGVRLLGYDSFEEIAKRNLEDSGFEPDYERSQFHEKMKREGSIIGLESAWKRKNGSTIYVRESATAVKDNHGNIVYYDGTFEDITERKQAEKKLRESEERYRLITHNAEDIIWTANMELRLTYASPSLERALGYTAEELMALSPEQILTADSLASGLVVFKEEVAAAQPKPDANYARVLEMEYRRKDGSTFWVEMKFSFFRDSSGRLTGVLGVGRDVTERKRAEQALRASEERYRSLFDRMMDGVYRSTHAGKFVDVNPAMVKMFGYSSKEEMLEVDIKNELYFAPDERGSHVLDTGQEETDVYRMRRKDGSEIWVEDHGSYVHDEQGRIIYHEGMLRDITGRKQIEDALAASEAELRALFASMQDAVLVIDREGVYRKIAPTNRSLLVKPPEELLGKNLKDFFPVEEAEAFRGAMQQVLATKQNAQIEYELIIGGRSVWFQTTISPLNADSTLWVAHDISNRKQAEQALQTAEANYRSIFENATIGIYQSTPQGGILSANPVMARIFGYNSPEEMLNSIASIDKQHYIDPADRQEFQRLLLEQGEVRELITENRRKDGGRIWVQENARAIKDAKGNVLRYEGFITDVSERKQAEEELRRAKEALETANLDLQQSLEREKLLACTDGLTGLCNHRYFFELAAREFHAASRYRRPLTFLMFDMDGFKQVNDTLGHTAGDRLLVRVAQTVVAQVRGSDVVARYGGDEFIVLLPHASVQQALPVAQRIRASVEALRVDGLRDNKESLAVTLSIGIAEMQHEPLDENVERIIQRADDALYEAKRSGRNRTVIFGQDEAGATQ